MLFHFNDQFAIYRSTQTQNELGGYEKNFVFVKSTSGSIRPLVNREIEIYSRRGIDANYKLICFNYECNIGDRIVYNDENYSVVDIKRVKDLLGSVTHIEATLRKDEQS